MKPFLRTILLASLCALSCAPAGAQELPLLTDAPPGCGPRSGLFDARDQPGACWRPYSDASPFNRRIPTRPRLHGDSRAIVRRLLGFGPPQPLQAGTAGTRDDWFHPTYYAGPSDPKYRVRCLERWGRCDVEGMLVPIPTGARPAAGGDGHMTVVDQTSGWEYDFWQARARAPLGGTLRVSWGGRTRIDGDGLGSDATAARFGSLAGIIRGPELAAGRIDHALFMTALCDSGSFVYPAMKSGRACADRADAPPMGARFQLAMSRGQIAALDVAPWKKTILRAMARYGMYMGDTGGGSWGLQFESGATYTSFGLADPLVALARAAGVRAGAGRFFFDLAPGVDWRRHLRVVHPCAARRTCSARP